MQYAHGQVSWLSADGATSTYTISGLAFQPKALRFYWVGINSAGGSPAENINERRGVGFAVSTSSRRSIGTFSQDTAATSNCGAAARDDCVVCTTDGAGASDGRLDLNAINSDGFQLIVDDAAPANITVFWEAWGGSDISVAVVGDIAEPAATGDQSYTVTGFTAGATDQVVMLAGCQSTAALNTDAAADSGLHVGFATLSAPGSPSSDGQVTVCGNSDDASAAMDTDGYCRTGQCLSMIVLAGGNPDAFASLTGFGANNFTLNWGARATTNRRSVFLALKGGAWAAGAYTIAGNSLNATATVSGLSFAPKGIATLGRMTAQDAHATATAEDRIGFGSGSSTSSRRSMGILDENGTASSVAEVNVMFAHDAVLCFPSAGGNVQAKYDIDAMNSDGFRIIVDTAGGVASEWQGYLAFGDVVSVGTGWATQQNHTVAGVGSVATLLDSYTQTPQLTAGVPATAGAGAVTAQNHTVSGAGITSSAGVAAVTAQNHTVSGVGLTASLGLATVTAQNHTIAGAGIAGNGASGAVTAQDHTVSGAGLTESTGAGAVTAQNHSVAGAGAAGVAAAGAVTQQNHTVAGAGSVASLLDSYTQTPQLTAGAQTFEAAGAVTAQNHSVTGAGLTGSVGAGAVTAQNHAVSAAGLGESLGAGAVVAQNHTSAGEGSTQGGLSGAAAVTAQDHTVSGAGLTGSVGAGAVTAQNHSVAGAGAAGVAAAGAVTQQNHTVAGAGSVASLLDSYTQTPQLTAGALSIEGTGAVSAQNHTVAGAGITGSVGQGAVVAQDHTASGTQAGEHPVGVLTRASLFGGSRRAGSFAGKNATSAGTGAVTAPDHTVSGSGNVIWVAFGQVTAQNHTVAGAGTVSGGAAAGDGAVQAQSATILAFGLTGSVGQASVTAQNHTASGSGTAGDGAVGVVTAQNHSASGQGVVSSIGSAAVSAQDHTTSGAGTVQDSGSAGSGAVTAQNHTVSGAGITGSVGTGAVQAQAHLVVGSDLRLPDVVLTIPAHHTTLVMATNHGVAVVPARHNVLVLKKRQ